jgi:hypothetical protein
MAGIIALLVALFLLLVVTRLATAALVLTGLSQEAARFQALSAFTGTGFTTGEAEGVVRHPVRRRIVMGLMVLHNAGLVTVAISLVLTFQASAGTMAWLEKMGWLAVVAGLVFLVSRSKLIDRRLSRAMDWALRRWTDLDTRDYVSLLNLAGKYTVREMEVEEGDWLAGKALKECRLPDAGISVLGITRQSGGYVGVPTGGTQVQAGDVLVLYGHADALKELDKRRACPPAAPGAAAPEEVPSTEEPGN